MRLAFRRPWPATQRGRKLWLVAILMGMKGGGYLFGKTSSSTDSALRLITERAGISLAWCGILMLAVCAFAMFCSYCHYGRDRWGYKALIVFCFAWAATFATAPLFLGGPMYAYQGSLNYIIAGVFLLISAGDVEVDPRRLR